MNGPHDFLATVRFQIRPCREADLEPLEWMGTYTAHRDTFRRVWRDHQRGTASMLVAEADAFPVGQLWVDLADQRHGLLWALRVLPGLRGAGIGRALLRAGERVAARAGRPIAQLSVAIDNERAARLYRALGYRRVGERVAEIEHRAHDGSRIVAREKQIVMEKVLDAPRQ
ncbi:GNAT family N-acetyltransferase [Sandaracinus amylolyticus]|uniref:GNAT family N-acetyltransferase n=1 Tax=Sandaracinus amylolyticus TaxID=927083 RepID=UPI001F42F94E|nr:GNAT family N-acetyltransferase [Sandaracinus amylolyticus]UJR83012.1 Hypothetical protein I5071_50770 [Sandaracinus amylolyticus]